MILLIAPVGAHAQCETELIPGQGQPGVSGVIEALTMWDPDGAGPGAPVLVVGGNFRAASSVSAGNVAVWDGSVWRALGDGEAPATVHALAVYRGELIAAGDVVIQGQRRVAIARWVGDLDAGRWEPLDDEAPLLKGRILALTVFEDQLIMGGGFGPVPGTGNEDLLDIASWDGTVWRGLDGGTNRFVRALAVYRGELIAGGQFTRAGQTEASAIARWDGVQWRSLDSGMSRLAGPAVNALVVYRGRLIAAGRFDRAGGVPASSIASWNGTDWSPLSTGLENGGVAALSVLNGRLYVGGTFTRIGGVDANRVASWSVVGPNANQWVGLADGVNALSNVTPFGGSVLALAPFDGRMIAGGKFTTAGEVGASSVGAWDGSEWHALGSGFNAAVSELTTFGAELVAAGGFTISVAGGQASGIARWDGEQWRSLGAGLGRGADRFPTIDVSALAKYQGELVVAGDFTRAGDRAVGGVARWNGSRWAPVGTGVPLPSENGFSSIRTLAQYRGELYAAGRFREIGGVPTQGVAAWDGGQWRAIGGIRPANPGGMAVFQGELYLGGTLKLDGHEFRSRVVSWDGTRWREVASMASSRGGDLLAVHQGELYSAPSRSGAPVWAWNGTSWRQIPTPPVHFNLSLTSAGGKLLVSGFGGMASWDGSEWRVVSEIDGISTVAMFRGELAVGHGSQLSDSPGLARLRLAEPLIARQPRSSPPVCIGGSHEFVVGPALGYEDSTFQWRRDGVPLSGPEATGRILSLSPIAPSDAGTYDCVVSNVCGSTVSFGAELRFCPADFDCSGLVNGADVSAFHNAWLAQDPTADFDGDGDVDNDDLVAFVAAWQAGCD